MRKIILDVDTGTDDAMAIIVAALSDQIDLKALFSVHGNLPLPQTLENTLRVAELVCPEVPVFAGCPAPLVRDIYPGRTTLVRNRKRLVDKNGEPVVIHAAELPLPKATKQAEQQHAVSYLIDTLRKEKCTVVAVGAATNIATALRMDPSIAENIDELVVMGGGVRKTNITQSAEANFFYDPEAAAIMMQANTRITLFPLDATSTATFSRKDAEDIIALGNDVAKFFGKLILDMVEFHEKTGFSSSEKADDYSAAIHDALCILYLIDPSIVLDIRHQTAFVHIGGGICDGMLVVDERAGMPTDRDVHITYKLDKVKVKAMLMELLK